jgi:hypothetical protein
VAEHHLHPIRPGDVLVLRDDDYLFAQGDIAVRVTAVYNLRQVRGEPWVFLGALELRADGHPRRRRDLLVRRDALRTRRRRPQ